MEICVIGAGYVGLTTSAVLADLGHRVRCIDSDPAKINDLNNGKIPIYEPGLSEVISNNKGRLTFGSDSGAAIEKSPILLIAVGTPSLPDGSTDLSSIYSVLETIADTILSYKTIITKSTVPPGTNQKIIDFLLAKGIDPNLFRVVSNPEFLREGTALYDMYNPNKTVVGVAEGDNVSPDILKELYKGIDAPLIITSLTGAEMIKYASNAFLAAKISYINEISRICDTYDVDVTEVAKGIGLDPRIGPLFLQSGLGYGGSCFPKDIKALMHSASIRNVETPLLSAVEKVNDSQVDIYITKLLKSLGNLSGKKVAVLGIAFKPETDDIRYSKAVTLIEKLLEKEAKVQVYDPKAMLPGHLQEIAVQHSQATEALAGADAAILATEWKEFLSLDWNKARNVMSGTVIMDARNCLDSRDVREAGLQYIGVGRP